jgi:hypothetical protein
MPAPRHLQCRGHKIRIFNPKNTDHPQGISIQSFAHNSTKVATNTQVQFVGIHTNTQPKLAIA